MSLIEIASEAVMNFLTLVADGLVTLGYGVIVATVIAALSIGGLLVIVKVVYPGVKGLYGILKDGLSGDKQPTFDSNTKLPQ